LGAVSRSCSPATSSSPRGTRRSGCRRWPVASCLRAARCLMMCKASQSDRRQTFAAVTDRVRVPGLPAEAGRDRRSPSQVTLGRGSSACTPPASGGAALIVYCRARPLPHVRSGGQRGGVQHGSTATAADGNGRRRPESGTKWPIQLRLIGLRGIRIEGVRGSNPLSSTTKAPDSGAFSISGVYRARS
jgi:hypothetical protein